MSTMKMFDFGSGGGLPGLNTPVAGVTSATGILEVTSLGPA